MEVEVEVEVAWITPVHLTRERAERLGVRLLVSRHLSLNVQMDGGRKRASQPAITLLHTATVRTGETPQFFSTTPLGSRRFSQELQLCEHCLLHDAAGKPALPKQQGHRPPCQRATGESQWISEQFGP